MQLIELVRLGAIGASLAFLYLGYRLMSTMINQPINSLGKDQLEMRRQQLDAIRWFIAASLFFFVSGGVLEYMTRIQKHILTVRYSPSKFPENIPPFQIQHNGEVVKTPNGEASISVREKDSLSLIGDAVVYRVQELQWEQSVDRRARAVGSLVGTSGDDGGFSDVP